MAISLKDDKPIKVAIIGYPDNHSIFAMELAHKLANDVTIPIVVTNPNLKGSFPIDENQKDIIITPKKPFKSDQLLISKTKWNDEKKVDFEKPKSKFHK